MNPNLINVTENLTGSPAIAGLMDGPFTVFEMLLMAYFGMSAGNYYVFVNNSYLNVETAASFAANYTFVSNIDKRSLNVIAVTTPTRALNTVYQPNASRPTLVIPSLSESAALSLSGGAAGTITFLCDASNPPTTPRSQIGTSNTGTLSLGINTVNGGIAPTPFLVPPGWYYKLLTATVSGTPTPSLVNCTEITL